MRTLLALVPFVAVSVFAQPAPAGITMHERPPRVSLVALHQQVPLPRHSATDATTSTALPVEAWLYAVDDGRDDHSSTLFRLGTTPGAGSVGLTSVGETGVEAILDITFMGNRLIGVAPGTSLGTSDDVFVEIDPDTGDTHAVGSMMPAGHFNALEADTAQTVLAATTEGEVWRIDLVALQATRLGTFGNSLQSSGDLALASSGTVYGTAHGIPSDLLVTVDRSNGHATPVGSIGYTEVYGLAFRPDNGTLLGIADAQNSPKLITLNTATGHATLLGTIPARNGITGLAVRHASAAGLTISNITMGNVSSVATTIDAWMDVTQNGSPLNPAGASVRVIAPDGTSLTTTAPADSQRGSTRWHASMAINDNPTAGTCAGRLCFEGGQLALTLSGSTTVVPDFSVNAYSTAFDMSTHAYQFANGDWAPSIAWFNDAAFRAGDTVAAYLTPTQRDTFWKHVGDFDFLFLVLAFESDGLCYGMANSAIANFTHRNDQDYWTDQDKNGEQCSTTPFCYFNTATDNSWQRGIDTRWVVPTGLAPGLSDRPYPDEDIFDITEDDDRWTIEAAKKIMFYFATQSFFAPTTAGKWPGRDRYAPIITGGDVQLGVKTLLREGNPVSVSFQIEQSASFPSGGGHAVVATQLLQWGSNTNRTSTLLLYDNNWPLPRTTGRFAPFAQMTLTNSAQSVSLDLARTDGTTVPVTGFRGPVNDISFRFLTAAGDSEHIYVISDRTAQDVTTPTLSPDAEASAGVTADSTYLHVVGIGIDTFTVYDGTTTTPVTVVRNGTLDGATAVYAHDPGSLLTEIFLPAIPGKRYRVECTKHPSVSRLKIFTTEPGFGGLLKTGYDNIQVSATDATRATFFVGVGNTDHQVRRTSAAGAQDMVAPTFSVPIAAIRRHAVRH